MELPSIKTEERKNVGQESKIGGNSRGKDFACFSKTLGIVWCRQRI